MNVTFDTTYLKYSVFQKKSNKGIVFIKYIIQINILKRINIMSQDKFSYDIERNGRQGMFIY